MISFGADADGDQGLFGVGRVQAFKSYGVPFFSAERAEGDYSCSHLVDAEGELEIERGRES